MLVTYSPHIPEQHDHVAGDTFAVQKQTILAPTSPSTLTVNAPADAYVSGVLVMANPIESHAPTAVIVGARKVSSCTNISLDASLSTFSGAAGAAAAVIP
jgi:hypothetical protein